METRRGLNVRMSVLIICAQVFFCRIIDVSLGTIRTILTVRGKKTFAAAVGFVEIFIWFLIVREALNNDIGGLWVAIAYAGGFASGTFIGGYLADRFLGGIIGVQVVTSQRDDLLVEKIQQSGFGVSVLNINPSDFGDEKYMLIIEIRNENLKKLEKIIYEEDPNAFIIVRETKYTQNGFIK